MTMRRAGTTGGVGRRDAAARLGISQWFHLGDAGRVEAAIAGLERLGIRHLRTNVSWADYHADGGEEWYRWLLPTLGRRFELLLLFDDRPERFPRRTKQQPEHLTPVPQSQR